MKLTLSSELVRQTLVFLILYLISNQMLTKAHFKFSHVYVKFNGGSQLISQRFELLCNVSNYFAMFRNISQ